MMTSRERNNVKLKTVALYFIHTSSRPSLEFVEGLTELSESRQT